MSEQPCPECDGYGFKDRAALEPCPACNGTGVELVPDDWSES